MKTQTNNLFPAISTAYLVQLSAEVKETLAVDFYNRPRKIFSAADMWNIERLKRNRIPRRFFI
jgi:hypothetical protein